MPDHRTRGRLDSNPAQQPCTATKALPPGIGGQGFCLSQGLVAVAASSVRVTVATALFGVFTLLDDECLSGQQHRSD